MNDWVTVVAGVAWAGGAVLFWTLVVLRSVITWRTYRDSRSRRELLNDFPLFLCALTASASLTLAVLREPLDLPSALRPVLSGLAWGSFAAAGLLRVLDDVRS